MGRSLIALLWLGLAAGGAQASGAPTAKQLDDRLARAREVYLEEGPQAGLPRFEEVLALYRETGNRRGEAITLGYIGNCHKRLGDYPTALEFLNRALAMKREIGDRLEEGKTLSHLGLVFWNMSAYAEATDHFERSIAIGRELGNPQLEGSALNNLSLVYDEQGDYPRSLDGYKRVLELYRGSDFPRGEGDTLGNIGRVHLLLGQYREAMSYFRRAFAISERLALKGAMSIDLGNLARAQMGIGEIDAALESFDRALALAVEVGLRKEEAVWLEGKAAALMHQGEYDEARTIFHRALDTYEAAGLKRELVEGLTETGSLYALLGDMGFADRSFRRGIQVAREIGSPFGVTVNLIALGDLERRRERFEEAAALYDEAVERARDAGLQAQTADSLVRLAQTYREQGRLDAALAEADRALIVARDIHARPVEAQALFTLGEVARDQGGFDDALAHYERARRIVDSVGGAELAWRVPYGRGQTLERMGRDLEAIEAYRQAAAVIQRTRDELPEERFRSGYMGDKYHVYIALVRLFVKLEQPEQAFHFSEKLRAQGYARLFGARGPPIRSPEQRRRELELRLRIRQLHRLMEQERAKPAPQQRDTAVSLFSSELLAAEREYGDFLDDLRASDPAASAAITLAVPPLEAVQGALEEGSALLEYVVADEGVLILVIRRDAVYASQVEFPRADLEAAVELLRGLILRTDSSVWLRPASRLQRKLIHPAETAGWLDGVERLYIVPHDVLHYLPFATLTDAEHEPPRLLMERYVLVGLPSALLLTERSGTANPGSLLAMAPERSNLKYAKREVERISSIFPDEKSVVIGRDATETRFKSEANEHAILHLATHAYFHKLSPLLSGLELEPDATEDGRLEVHEIAGLHLGARLVTLSACDTALGSGYFAEVPAGDDFVGLTRAFLFAGSAAVMASLWKVNDRSTHELMGSFYRELSKTDPASALARAQRRMRNAGDGHDHPYFWAPFVVLGANR